MQQGSQFAQEPKLGGFGPSADFPRFDTRPASPSVSAVEFEQVGSVSISGVVTARPIWRKTIPVAIITPERSAYLRAHSELQNHLASLQSRGFITLSEMQEVMHQHEVLEAHRQELAGHTGQVVVAAGGELFFAETLDEAIKEAKSKYGDRPHYSESIDVVEYPSPLG